MQYIKDHAGRIIGTISQDANKTTVRDFKSGKTVATYNAATNRTRDWRTNRTMQGNQAIRFLR